MLSVQDDRKLLEVIYNAKKAQFQLYKLLQSKLSLFITKNQRLHSLPKPVNGNIMNNMSTHSLQLKIIINQSYFCKNTKSLKLQQQMIKNILKDIFHNTSIEIQLNNVFVNTLNAECMIFINNIDDGQKEQLISKLHEKTTAQSSIYESTELSYGNIMFPNKQNIDIFQNSINKSNSVKHRHQITASIFHIIKYISLFIQYMIPCLQILVNKGYINNNILFDSNSQYAFTAVLTAMTFVFLIQSYQNVQQQRIISKFKNYYVQFPVSDKTQQTLNQSEKEQIYPNNIQNSEKTRFQDQNTREQPSFNDNSENDYQNLPLPEEKSKDSSGKVVSTDSLLHSQLSQSSESQSLASLAANLQNHLNRCSGDIPNVSETEITAPAKSVREETKTMRSTSTNIQEPAATPSFTTKMEPALKKLHNNFSFSTTKMEMHDQSHSFDSLKSQLHEILKEKLKKTTQPEAIYQIKSSIQFLNIATVKQLSNLFRPEISQEYMEKALKMAYDDVESSEQLEFSLKAAQKSRFLKVNFSTSQSKFDVLDVSLNNWTSFFNDLDVPRCKWVFAPKQHFIIVRNVSDGCVHVQFLNQNNSEQENNYFQFTCLCLSNQNERSYKVNTITEFLAQFVSQNQLYDIIVNGIHADINLLQQLHIRQLLWNVNVKKEINFCHPEDIVGISASHLTFKNLDQCANLKSLFLLKTQVQQSQLEALKKMENVYLQNIKINLDTIQYNENIINDDYKGVISNMLHRNSLYFFHVHDVSEIITHISESGQQELIELTNSNEEEFNLSTELKIEYVYIGGNAKITLYFNDEEENIVNNNLQDTILVAAAGGGMRIYGASQHVENFLKQIEI